MIWQLESSRLPSGDLIHVLGADQCCHDEYGSRVDRRLSSYGVQSVEGVA